MSGTAQAFMSVCESQTAGSPRYNQTYVKWVIIKCIHVHTYVIVVWLVIFVGTNLVKQAKIWV